MILARRSYSRQYKRAIWQCENDPLTKKNYFKGQHGSGLTRRNGNFAIQLREKQIMRLHYGMEEKQFGINVARAKKMKGNIVDNIAGLLESRLDTMVYRANFAPTIFFAKQIVGHGKVLVNGKRVNIPSYRVKVGDVVEIVPSFRNNSVLSLSFGKMFRTVPDYLELNKDDFSIKMNRHPLFSEIPFGSKVRVSLVIEYYSQRL